MIRALQLLNYLAVLDNAGNSTKHGQRMSEFPLDPQMSTMLVVSPEFNCSHEILSITARLSGTALLIPTVIEVVVLQTRSAPMISASTP